MGRIICAKCFTLQDDLPPAVDVGTWLCEGCGHKKVCYANRKYRKYLENLAATEVKDDPDGLG